MSTLFSIFVTVISLGTILGCFLLLQAYKYLLFPLFL